MGARLRLAKRLGGLVGNVTVLVDNILHAFARVLGETANVVDHMAHGGYGDPGKLGDFFH